MNFITYFLTISPNTQRPYFTPAVWTKHSVPGKNGKPVALNAVDNGGNRGKLPEGAPSAILPAADADHKNLPAKISYDTATSKVVAFVATTA